MAEFLKTKTSTFVNRPVGIVSTNTGATEVGNAIAKLGSEIQDRAFRDAVVEQEKLGQDTVMNLSVLDENNKLVMRQLPTRWVINFGQQLFQLNITGSKLVVQWL